MLKLQPKGMVAFCKEPEDKKNPTKGMKCPKCNKEIDHVDVFAVCYQKGHLIGNEITGYSSLNIESTQNINCPECHEDISTAIKET